MPGAIGAATTGPVGQHALAHGVGGYPPVLIGNRNQRHRRGGDDAILAFALGRVAVDSVLDIGFRLRPSPVFIGGKFLLEEGLGFGVEALPACHVHAEERHRPAHRQHIEAIGDFPPTRGVARRGAGNRAVGNATLHGRHDLGKRQIDTRRADAFHETRHGR